MCIRDSKSTDGTITVPSGGSKYVDIDAVTGPAPTVKVTTADGYVFLGWYKDGVKLTEDETYTVTAVDGLFTSGTYEAHFRALSSICLLYTSYSPIFTLIPFSV